MRTNIVIYENLMKRAMKVSGLKTKKATVEAGLKLLVTLKEQKRIKTFRGKLNWEGNLEQMRLGQ
ncbi:type II toxin-antitoxin system VapB family antitoxin [Membranihabitans maritimus]|uniref:type II toxin-antitoxin system VapB family antitoxin n=1 Tax=Membranihabitans maritimus TaxID=2904244 RepID=UPI001F323D75|nr:type II toxin-antitoxin system VapB family antitoxin [Membranihabitans maritimus]